MAETLIPPESGAFNSRVFVPIDWAAPLDVDLYVRSTPRSATIRGFFFLACGEQAKRNGLQLQSLRERYVPFTEYPLREFISVLVETATALYPERPLRSALREVGRGAFPVFASSLVGRVTIQEHDATPVSCVRDLETGYKTAMPQCTVVATVSSESVVEVLFERVYSFLDSHHVGVIEGVFHSRGFRAETSICVRSLSAAIVRCTVRPLASR